MSSPQHLMLDRSAAQHSHRQTLHLLSFLKAWKIEGSKVLRGIQGLSMAPVCLPNSPVLLVPWAPSIGGYLKCAVVIWKHLSQRPEFLRELQGTLTLWVPKPQGIQLPDFSLNCPALLCSLFFAFALFAAIVVEQGAEKSGQVPWRWRKHPKPLRLKELVFTSNLLSGFNSWEDGAFRLGLAHFALAPGWELSST